MGALASLGNLVMLSNVILGFKLGILHSVATELFMLLSSSGLPPES